MGELREKCAVVGVANGGDESTAAIGYESLFAMQHRGAEASGLAVIDDDRSIKYHRGNGLVTDVYDKEIIHSLTGDLLVGHNRYSTSGSKKGHPLPYVDDLTGFGFAHNGNLPDTHSLAKRLDKRNIKTKNMNDSEMMGADIEYYLRSGRDLPDAVEKAYPHFKGAFSCTAVHEDTVVAFRDSHGIRPLALGTLEDGTIVASETCGLDIVDAEYVREVRPGELVIITKDGIESKQLAEGTETLDMFELVYFARHDSQLYGQSVNEIRRRFGEMLAKQFPPLERNFANTVVIPVPDTSVPAAEGYAQVLGLEHRQGIIKNRYIGRTFMSPTQESRKKHLRRKHNVLPEAVYGKDVVLVDDSIVRGNTMPRLVSLIKSLGATSVTVLIASPPVRFPDYYGIDTPKQEDLMAFALTVEEMKYKIGCDYLGFLSLDNMVAATNRPAEDFNLAAFNGVYPIEIGRNKQKISAPVSMEFAA